MTCTAFQITQDDVENVLQSHSLRVINQSGQSFSSLAAELIDEIDANRVEKAALNSSPDLDEQTAAAHSEIKDILCELGVLEF